jgi:hypothetical protein
LDSVEDIIREGIWGKSSVGLLCGAFLIIGAVGKARFLEGREVYEAETI